MRTKKAAWHMSNRKTDVVDNKKLNDENTVFALDIGTRSVIGIVAEKNEDNLKIITTKRQEHKTRSMLDGQIHDVPQVAQVICAVKEGLEESVGPLKKVSVAAAGRALYTMTAQAKLEVDGVIDDEQEKHLDFIAVQAAQKKLAESNMAEDMSLYYCVGYSTVSYALDGVKLKSLVGQRGKIAVADVIATFLPRQVVDSMQSALKAAGLEMHALTLEPIAAISVLIPTTMRHLNLVLVDIGAGTSDVAITRDGSVVAYGMVPMAGDEITEAISKQYLLDFNVAEAVKRQLSMDGVNEVKFTDILGMDYALSGDEIVDSVMENVTELAQAIANQILELNAAAPQAVMLVGGGALTPRLSEKVAEKLSMPVSRVAVRMPDKVDDITDIPDTLKAPDAVTPLGILKTACIQTLNLIAMYVNDAEYNMFNFKELTIADVLLNAGINLHKYNGKPGLGIGININGEQKMISGTMGTLAKLKLNGQPASLSDKVEAKAHIVIEHGENGAPPQMHLCDVIKAGKSVNVYINGELTVVQPRYLLNGQLCTDTAVFLKDKDEITYCEHVTIADALENTGYDISNAVYNYTLNGISKVYESAPQIQLNGQTAYLSDEVQKNDEIDFKEPQRVPLKNILHDMSVSSDITVLFNDKPCVVHTASNGQISVNDNAAASDYLLNNGDEITCTAGKQHQAIIGDVLLAADYTPPKPGSQVSFELLRNNAPAEFTTLVNENDNIKVVLKPFDVKTVPENGKN
jgi:cell division protein FtsA